MDITKLGEHAGIIFKQRCIRHLQDVGSIDMRVGTEVYQPTKRPKMNTKNER